MEIEEIEDMLRSQEIESNMAGRVFKTSNAALISSFNYL